MKVISFVLLLIPSQEIVFGKKKNWSTLKIYSAASTGGQEKNKKSVSFPWSPVVASLSIPMFCF